MKTVTFTDKQFNRLKETIEWVIYWRSFVLCPSTKEYLNRILKRIKKIT